MKISVDISYYPLNDTFVPPIIEFIKRLNTHNGITAITNGMSTQVFGEYEIVMDVLKAEIQKSFSLDHSVFVMKMVNADLQTHE